MSYKLVTDRMYLNGQVVSYKKKIEENLINSHIAHEFCLMNGISSMYVLLSFSDAIKNCLQRVS